MKNRAVAVILGLIFGSLGGVVSEDGVAPTRAEVAALYTAAAAQLNAGNYAETLKQLDALDARQADLAAAKNLRGVALMRLKEYGLAEKALQKARELDPNLWEARFNLAELSFLEKKWSEARERFQALAAEPNEPERETTADLIQFKIFLTCLLGGRGKEAAAMRVRFESLGGSPLHYYARAAVAFQEKDETGARVNLRAAEKSASREAHALFLESFYEVGWMEKPDDARPVALETGSKSERLASAQSDFEKAQRAFRAGDYGRALELLETVEEVTPSQAAVYNLRGEIFLAQGKLEDAERAFRNALVANPELEEARFNLARLSFRKGEYEKSRREFEALLGATAGGKRGREREALIRYHLYLALLLEGRDAAAQKTLEEFKMMDRTPALYYAQAAWAFRHDNPRQARNWVANAGNLFSQELNRAFVAPLADLGWLGNGVTASPTPIPIAAQPTPAATSRASAAATPTQVGVVRATESTTSPKSEALAAETTIAATGKKPRRGESEQSETRPKRQEQKKRTGRGKEPASQRSEPAAARAKTRASISPTPSLATTPAPAVVQRRVRENLGDKVRNLILYPFQRRGEQAASPSPRPTPEAKRRN